MPGKEITVRGRRITIEHKVKLKHHRFIATDIESGIKAENTSRQVAINSLFRRLKEKGIIDE